jgi:hypothetical protein
MDRWTDKQTERLDRLMCRYKGIQIDWCSDRQEVGCYNKHMNRQTDGQMNWLLDGIDKKKVDQFEG